MATTSPNSLPYRRGVGVVLVNARGKVFAAERLNMPGAWQMPQGGIDKGESPRKAAMRELLEETGTDKAEIVAVTTKWLRYDLPPELLGMAWKGKYRGQEQKWFLMRFTGKDSDINIATEHPEFGRWKWVSLSRLIKQIVPFKRDLYAGIVAELAPLVAKMGKAKAKKKAPAKEKGAKKK